AFELRAGRGLVRAHGGIDRRGEQDLDLELRDVGLAFLSRWLNRKDLSGHVDGTLAMRGPAAAPRATGDLTVALLTDGRPSATLITTLEWAASRLHVDGRLASPAGDSLTWTARLPFALSLAPADSTGARGSVQMFEGDVNASVSARGFRLQALTPLLDPSQVGDLAGTLDTDLRLTGNAHALAGSGRLRVTNGNVRLHGLGVTYGGLDLDGEFQGDRLLVHRATAVSGKGTLDA